MLAESSALHSKYKFHSKQCPHDSPCPNPCLVPPSHPLPLSLLRGPSHTWHLSVPLVRQALSRLWAFTHAVLAAWNMGSPCSSAGWLHHIVTSQEWLILAQTIFYPYHLLGPSFLCQSLLFSLSHLSQIQHYFIDLFFNLCFLPPLTKL